MEILNIKEQEDGSAIVEMVMTEEENNFFVEYAITNILREKLERIENGEIDMGAAISDT